MIVLMRYKIFRLKFSTLLFVYTMYNINMYVHCFFLFFSVPIQISSFSLSPHNCLLRGAVNQLQCVASGLPEPNVTFRRGLSNPPTLIRCLDDDDNCTISISQIHLGLVKTVVTANLTFLNPSEEDNGETCLLN